VTDVTAGIRVSGAEVDGDRITFEVVARGQRLEFSVSERPEGDVVVE
jgi:hypothetical protein